MILLQWKDETGTSNDELAAMLQTSKGTLNHYLYGYREPRSSFLNRVYRLTGGLVGLEDWDEHRLKVVTYRDRRERRVKRKQGS